MTTRNEYDEKGYVIVHDLVSPEEFEDLKSACSRAVDRTRSGSWTYRRTVGKQFPPYGQDSLDSWGVQHVMHPDLNEPAFAKWYTSDRLVDVVKKLLNCEEKDLQMELFNLLINPLDHEFALRWHRDDIKESATETEEKFALGKWNFGVQWNTALYEDSCLYLVPTSHKYPRSPVQRAHSSTLEPPSNPLDMPGAIQLTLNPGDTVFYNSNILHTAAYHSSPTRATLHATMGDVHGGSTRARNMLQHGLLWMEEEKFVSGLSERGKLMHRNLMEMQERMGQSELGYSLVN